MKKKDQKSKSKKKPQKRRISIEIGKEYIDISKMTIPKSMEMWNTKNKPTEAYFEMLNLCLTLARYIANQLNTGPEVKDSISKRAVATKMILWELLFSVYIDGYHRTGLLSETLNDVYMDNNGRAKVMMLLASIQHHQRLQQLKKMKEKMGSYVQ